MSRRIDYQQLQQYCQSFEQCLQQLQPLSRQMHLLSANAVSSATRAGTAGAAFRVLTQDIQLLGKDIAQCLEASQQSLATLLALIVGLEQTDTALSASDWRQLDNRLRQLQEIMEPMLMLVRKGEYLAVCSAVEAASAGDYGSSFEAVATMLRSLVQQLAAQRQQQQRLLDQMVDLLTA